MSADPTAVPAVPVLPYATPVAFQPAGVWRDGATLVAHRNATFPDRCVKCNAAADGKRWNRKLYWHHPAFYLLIIFPGLLIYVIVALCIRKSAKVSVGLCRKHRAVRRNGILLGWLIGLLGISGMIGSVMVADVRIYRNSTVPLWMLLGGIALFLFGLIWGMIRSRVVAPTRIDEQYVWLRGAGPAFLGELPPAKPGA